MKARAGGDIFLAASTVLSKYVTKTHTAIFFGSVQKASLFLEQPSKMENLQFAQGILRELRQRAEADGEKLLTYLIDWLTLRPAIASGRVGSGTMSPKAAGPKGRADDADVWKARSAGRSRSPQRGLENAKVPPHLSARRADFSANAINRVQAGQYTKPAPLAGDAGRSGCRPRSGSNTVARCHSINR